MGIYRQVLYRRLRTPLATLTADNITSDSEK